MAGNPVKYIDPRGDSIKLGTIVNAETLSALQAVAETDEGYDYLKQFAAKGDAIGSVVFEESGKYNENGFNLIYEEGKDLPPYAEAVTKQDDKNITVYLTDEYKSEFNKAQTVLHETFMHAEMFVQDYKDDKKFNKSNISAEAMDMASGQKEHFQHKQSRINEERQGFDNTLFPGAAYRISLKINESLKAGYNPKQVKFKLLDYYGR